MIFVGAQSINTRAMLANKNIYLHDFFLWGHLGALRICAPPPPPRP